LKKLFLLVSLVVVLIQPTILWAQAKPQDHQIYLKLLGSAKDSLYNQTLKTYDRYIRQHPTEYLVQIERCRFIQNAYDSEEYNPKYDEVEKEIKRLLREFPDIPEVQLYQADFMYGDSVITYLENIVANYNAYPARWKGKLIWQAFHKLATAYAAEDNHELSIKYGELAMAKNDTLDISYLVASAYQAQKQPENAKRLLLRHLRATNEGWELNQKGKLLLELGLPNKAMQAFRWAKKDSASYQDADGMAEALIRTGLYKEARTFLAKNAVGEYSEVAAKRKLFQYDLQYSPVDSARVSYEKLVHENFLADPLGFYRLQLFLHAPMLPWQLPDILRVLLIFLFIVVVLVWPYIWILPIHYVSNYYKGRGMTLPATPFRWTLRHFWYMCSGLLFIDVLSNLLFRYDSFFAEAVTKVEEVISQQEANQTLFFMVGGVLITTLLLQRTDFLLIRGQIWTLRKSIYTGIGLAFLVRLLLGIYLVLIQFIGISQTAPLTFLSIQDSIISLNQFYHPALGFLFVVLLVPFYEEILFRGVFLSSCEKHMRFFIANSLQAFLFALLHQELKLIPFYFAFGYLAGYFRRKSQSLAPGISMHVTNNCLAFLSLLLKS
jgi:membrane protease YdiL (CAAX protease family)